MRKLFFAFVIAVVAFTAWLPTQLHGPTADIKENSSDTASKTRKPVTAAVVTEVPDFSSFTDVRAKKSAFFEFLGPIVQAENFIIYQQRERLLALQEQGELTLDKTQMQWLLKLADDYGVEVDLDRLDSTITRLLRRVDVVPETLVLVQAANESGWGSSRFSKDALNLFGQWCFSRGCGLVPDSRLDGAVHEVRKFSSVNASVRSYLRNINTHPAYFQLRQLRAQQRQKGDTLRAIDLTQGLMQYSERGEAYIEELNSMIRVNRPLIQSALEPSSNSAP